MIHRVGLSLVFLLSSAVILTGCRNDPPAPPVRMLATAEDPPKSPPPTETKQEATDLESTPPKMGSTGDEVVATLPEATKQQLYDQAMQDAVDRIAERQYTQALEALEKAQKHQDTGAVQREIDRVRALLDQDAAADKAIKDVKTILDDGKPEEAAKLATAALGQFGGGDQSSELARLKQEADAVVNATSPNNAVRRASLKAEAEAALTANNLRAAAIALEQATSMENDPALDAKLTDLRQKLQTYDDNRKRAAELRRDPTRIDEALTLLQQARDSWSTLVVQQEIDEAQLILERRRDRVGVADFEVLGEVGLPEAGRIVAAELLPHFRPRFDVVEQAQIQRIMAEMNLPASDVGDSLTAREQLGKATRLRYLVVGSLSSLGGVTLQARLVEVPTGLVVQTARLTAPSVEALTNKLKQVALILQMSDDQKALFEEALRQKVEAVKPIDPAPVAQLPPPPPPPAPAAPPPPPLVTFSPQPPALGGLVIEDFNRFPAVALVPAAPPPALGLVIAQNDPRRNRLFRLSLELGDNCFRRGLFKDALRHFTLALAIGGPRRELVLRIDSCRPLIAPPPPPPVVVVPPPIVIVPQPVVVIPQPVLIAPQPVIVVPPPPPVLVRPPVVLARPRVAVFGFLVNCRPGLVPPAASELFADQFAGYCRGSYEIIDRGEVCWYMGRLGLTMREVLNDPIARRCLAESLNARYFVFGSLRETASFDVETHLIDAETGSRTGTGKIHVKDQQELKLRIGELARQIGANSADQQNMVKKAASSEKTLNEARGLLAANPARAAEVARKGLEADPENVALRSLVTEADKRVRLARLEEQRRAENARQAKLIADQKKRQEQLAKQAEEARKAAEAAAASRSEAERKEMLAQREKAALGLRNQARDALAKGQPGRAVQLLQSAVGLQPSEALYQELAKAKVEAEKTATNRRLEEEKKRQEAAQKAQLASQQKIQAERETREKQEEARRKADEARMRKVHDASLAQARNLLAKKEFAGALAAAQSAQRNFASPESAALIREASEALALANAPDSKEKAALEAEKKARLESEKQQVVRRDAYAKAMKDGQDALMAKKYTEAETAFVSATKLFNTPAAQGGLKTVRDLQAQEKKRDEAELQAKKELANRAARVNQLLVEGKKFRETKQFAKAIESYRTAVQLAPNNVEAVAGLSATEEERNVELDRQAKIKQMNARQDAIVKYLATARAALSRKQFPEAEKAARQVLQLDPNNVDATALLQQIGKGTPPMPPMPNPAFVAWLQKGQAALAEKKFQAAAQAFDEALKLKPGDPAAQQGRAQARAALMARPPMPPGKGGQPMDKEDKTKQREEDFQLALSAARDAMKKNDHAGALAAYNEALRLKPADKTALSERNDALYASAMARGLEAFNAKRFPAALRSFDEALKAKPGDPMATRYRKEAAAANAKKP